MEVSIILKLQVFDVLPPSSNSFVKMVSNKKDKKELPMFEDCWSTMYLEGTQIDIRTIQRGHFGFKNEMHVDGGKNQHLLKNSF